MTLAEAKQIFAPVFLQQINTVNINGNFGDAVMNPETVNIIEYFKKANPDITIIMSTNGGARDTTYWQQLAVLGVQVEFCLDGLEDTHSLYRQNTIYSTVIKNAKAFIAAGGRAVWKMIRFDHNAHQIDQARLLSKQMGFADFKIHDHGRDQAPVFDLNQQLKHTIGKPQQTEFSILWKSRTQDEVLLEDIVSSRSVKNISCQVKKRKSIYVSSTGDVYPCCFLGFSPKTYGHGHYHQAANAQFRDFVQENNAFEHDLEHCIAWFDSVEKTWSISTFEAGRLVICNDVCGSDSNK
jgi:sulfatase maturation enzyme AslB (radical SAM superfamily)